MQRREFVWSTLAGAITPMPALAKAIEQPKSVQSSAIDGFPEGLEIVRFGVPEDGEFFFTRDSPYDNFKIFLCGAPSFYKQKGPIYAFIVKPKTGFRIEQENICNYYFSESRCVKDEQYTPKTINGIVVETAIQEKAVLDGFIASQKYLNTIALEFSEEATRKRLQKNLEIFNTANAKARL